MARETYFSSEMGQGQIKVIKTLATGQHRGITAADLLKADMDAKNKVDMFVLELAGATKAATIIAEFADTSNDVDPIFVQLAELAAAVVLLAKWEEFNYGGERPTDADLSRAQLESARCKSELESILEHLVKTKATLKADGTVRTLSYRSGSMGPVVVGPLSKGSYFDYEKYIDVFGIRRDPIQRDPYQDAH